MNTNSNKKIEETTDNNNSYYKIDEVNLWIKKKKINKVKLKAIIIFNINFNQFSLYFNINKLKNV